MQVRPRTVADRQTVGVAIGRNGRAPSLGSGGPPVEDRHIRRIGFYRRTVRDAIDKRVSASAKLNRGRLESRSRENDPVPWLHGEGVPISCGNRRLSTVRRTLMGERFGAGADLPQGGSLQCGRILQAPSPVMRAACSAERLVRARRLRGPVAAERVRAAESAPRPPQLVRRARGWGQLTARADRPGGVPPRKHRHPPRLVRLTHGR